MKIDVITITKETADRLLSVNAGNRTIRRSNVIYWKKCLEDGTVRLTHQGIALEGTLDNPVRLLDGQHRLIAISETGIPCKMAVATNVDPEGFSDIDNGLNRTLGDRTSSTTKVASICNTFFALFGGTSRRATMGEINRIMENISPILPQISNTHGKSLSIAGATCAFILQQKIFKMNFSSAWETANFNALTPSLVSLCRRQLLSPITGGGSNRAAIFCMVWKAIENPEQTRIQIPAAPQSRAAEILKSNWPDLM